MNCKMEKLTLVAMALVLAFGFASTASAQVFTGRVASPSRTQPADGYPASTSISAVGLILEA